MRGRSPRSERSRAPLYALVRTAEQLAETAVAVLEECRHASARTEAVREPAQRAQRQPVGQPVLDPRAALALSAFREPVAVLPAREGAGDLRVHEAVGRVELTDDHAPASRQPRRAEVEDGARGQPGRRRRQPARPGPRGMEPLEVARVREELEHLGTWTRKPHAALENVVRHGGRAIIGGCPTPVKRGPTSPSP